MITLTCTKCKATLEMDEAFAGGVCRCQYCGTIQTVPAHLKQQSERGAVAASAGGGKALYSTKAAGAGLPSSGLDELANVVASSGLANGALANRRETQDVEGAARTAPPGSGTKAAGSRRVLMIVGGALVAGLLGGVVWLARSRPAAGPIPQPVVASGQVPTPTPSQAVTAGATGPRFLDIPLNEPSVVYLLDRGASNREVFDPLKAALYESLRSLGSDRNFQVIFWPRAGEGGGAAVNVNEFAYPKGNFAKANADRLKDCEGMVGDVSANGTTDLGPALREAMRRSPKVIVIATAKGYNLDDKVVQQVERARGGKTVKIHTVDLNRDGDGRTVLRAISDQTGGTYKHVPPSSLGGG